MEPFALVIHGGAMIGLSSSLSESARRERIAALHESLRQGFEILAGGGSALDAAIRAVTVMEDCPLFNAGRGAVLASNGTVEMDAAVMDGASGRCGGVSAVMTIKNPILAARAVMDRSPHSLLCARGAESFAGDQGLELADNSYFQTEERRRALEEVLAGKRFEAARALGTVGAAARDKDGNLAAATSTGGLTGKLPGRVSDSSIAGAGTWAANGVCALSCTGTGDVFIRNATARDIACMAEYKGMPLAAAIRAGLDKVAKAGGTGGVIGLGPRGPAIMDYNTDAMSRGFLQDGGEPFAAIF
jgi:L-asparaginase / beta-aspartyl-peptidase